MNDASDAKRILVPLEAEVRKNAGLSDGDAVPIEHLTLWVLGQIAAELQALNDSLSHLGAISQDTKKIASRV